MMCRCRAPFEPRRNQPQYACQRRTVAVGPSPEGRHPSKDRLHHRRTGACLHLLGHSQRSSDPPSPTTLWSRPAQHTICLAPMVLSQAHCSDGVGHLRAPPQPAVNRRPIQEPLWWGRPLKVGTHHVPDCQRTPGVLPSLSGPQPKEFRTPSASTLVAHLLDGECDGS